MVGLPLGPRVALRLPEDDERRRSPDCGGVHVAPPSTSLRPVPLPRERGRSRRDRATALLLPLREKVARSAG